MFFTKGGRKYYSYLAVLGALLLVFALTRSSTDQALDDPAYIGSVRIFDPDFTVPHAAGLAFLPSANVFLVLSVEETENLTMISPFDEQIGSANLPAIEDPINLAFDSKGNRLLLFDTVGQELIAIEADRDGYVDPAAVSGFEAQPFGVRNPRGMAVDPVSGALFILNGADSRIVCIRPDVQGGFDGAAALAEGRISQIDLSGIDLSPLQGLAFNPTDGHLYVLNPDQLMLYEVSETGQLVAARDLSTLDLGFRDPQGIVFAPSADLTDDPAQMHLFLIDSGLGPLSTAPLRKGKLSLPYIVGSVRVDGSSASQELAPSANEGGQAEVGPGRIIEFTLTWSGLIPNGR